jgi:streptogramin lyase
MKSIFLRALAPVLLALPLMAQVQPGDVLVGYAKSPGIEVLRPDGTLVLSASGLTGSGYTGVVLSPEGLLVTARSSPQPGLDFADATGAEVRAFATPQVTGVQGDLAVFSDGVFATVDQDAGIRLFDALGLHLGSISVPGMLFPIGCWIDDNDDLWIAEIGLSSSFGTIWHLDRTGVVLGSITVGFSPGDVVVAPDGTLWVPGRLDGVAYHLDATGAVLGSFPAVVAAGGNTFYGLALAADGTLYATALKETQLLHYDATGNLLGTIPLGGTTPFFIRMAGDDGGGILGSPDQLSLAAGGSQKLSVFLDPAHAGGPYLVLGSVTGTTPGVTFAGVTVPLNLDGYLMFTLLNPNTPLLNGSSGVLNSLGQATAVLSLPPASDPSLAGLTVQHAALALDLSGGSVALVDVTGTAELALVP